MRRLLLLGLLLLGCDSDERGVSVSRLAAIDGSFDPAQSAAVFIGVQKYEDDAGLTRVQFAVDDAIDLAHHFVLECGLIPAKRAIVAISGSAVKEQSKTRLQKLKNAGVRVIDAIDVLASIREVAQPNGLLVVSFAGHGFSKDGTPYLATSTARLDDSRTWLSAAAVMDEAAQSAARSLVLLDACRERLEESRAVGSSPLSVGALIPKMTKAHGQVVLYAAPAGGYAYDDMERRNGVFTAAVIDGLQCNAGTATITVDKLANFVAKEVRDWVVENKDPQAKSVIQVSVDDKAKKMPLRVCGGALPPPPPNPDDVVIQGTQIVATSKAGKPLFAYDFKKRVTHAAIADLDADKISEVIAATGQVVTIFESDGRVRKTIDAGAQIRKFDVDKLFWNDPTQQIVALTNSARESLVLIIDRVGEVHGKYRYAGELRELVITTERPAAHLRKIIVSAFHEVVLLDPRRLIEEEWRSRSDARITDIAVGMHHSRTAYDIEIRTTRGVAYLDLDGRELGSGVVPMQLFAPR